MDLKVAAIQLNSGADPRREPGGRRPPRAGRGSRGGRPRRPAREVDRDGRGSRSCGTPPRISRAPRSPGPARRRASSTSRSSRARSSSGCRGREKLANTSVHIDAAGLCGAVYRKLHMFDVEVDGRVYRESDLEDPGDEIVLSETRGGLRLGLAICYDLRFPELFRILALRGARVIVLPAAFTLATTRDHWETLLRARAIENQVFLVAANQFGSHPGGNRSGGRSLIVDPWGIVLAQMPDREGHVCAELDLERQDEIRARLPVLSNRRPLAYRWPEPADREPGPGDAAGARGRRARGPPAGGHERSPAMSVRQREARATGQAPGDPRCRREGLRPPGLPRLPGRGRGRGGRRRIRARLPLLRFQGRDPQHALPRALGRCCSA